MLSIVAAYGILLLGVIIGIVIDSWQLSILAAILSLGIVAIWSVSRMRAASQSLREIRTELRHLRAERKNSSSQIGQGQQRQLASENMLKELSEQIDEIDSGIRGIDHKHSQVESILQRVDKIEKPILAAYELEAENRTSIEGFLEKLDETKLLVARTKQQLNRSVRRQVETFGLVELLEGKFTARIDYIVDEVQLEMERTRRDIANISRQLVQLKEAGPTNQTISVGKGEQVDHSKYLYYLSYQIPKEIEALEKLGKLYQPSGRTPLLGGWALTPTGMLDITNAINRHHPGIIIECGSGTSTLWMAMAVRAAGSGHIYALEHDLDFANSTRELLIENDLSEYATVIHAPIVEHKVNDREIEWYDIRELRGVSRIDLLVVDGPPQALGELRGGVMSLLGDRLAEGAHIFADDVNRQSERQMVRAWLEDYPDLQLQKSSTPVQSHLLRSNMEKL